MSSRYEISLQTLLVLLFNWLSSKNFFSGAAISIVMKISFVMLIFLLFLDQISGGGKSL